MHHQDRTSLPATPVEAMGDTNRKLRYEVINFFLKEYRPSTIQDLVNKGLGDESTVAQGL